MCRSISSVIIECELSARASVTSRWSEEHTSSTYSSFTDFALVFHHFWVYATYICKMRVTQIESGGFASQTVVPVPLRHLSQLMERMGWGEKQGNAGIGFMPVEN